jgi:lysozyme family protein
MEQLTRYEDIKGKKMELNRFEAFLSESIRWETGGDKSGAYTNDPSDAGGETKWGISKRSNPEVDIKNLTYKDAVEIYRIKYYNPYYDLIMSENMAFKVCDMGILSGPSTSVKMLQRTIRNGAKLTLKIDGKLGPLTLTALHMAMAIVGEKDLYALHIKRLKRRFLRIVILRPWNKKFLQGWYNRADFYLKPFVEKEINEKPKSN